MPGFNSTVTNSSQAATFNHSTHNAHVSIGSESNSIARVTGQLFKYLLDLVITSVRKLSEPTSHERMLDDIKTAVSTSRMQVLFKRLSIQITSMKSEPTKYRIGILAQHILDHMREAPPYEYLIHSELLGKIYSHLKQQISVDEASAILKVVSNMNSVYPMRSQSSRSTTRLLKKLNENTPTSPPTQPALTLFVNLITKKNFSLGKIVCDEIFLVLTGASPGDKYEYTYDYVEELGLLFNNILLGNTTEVLKYLKTPNSEINRMIVNAVNDGIKYNNALLQNFPTNQGLLGAGYYRPTFDDHDCRYISREFIWHNTFRPAHERFHIWNHALARILQRFYLWLDQAAPGKVNVQLPSQLSYNTDVVDQVTLARLPAIGTQISFSHTWPLALGCKSFTALGLDYLRQYDDESQLPTPPQSVGWYVLRHQYLKAVMDCPDQDKGLLTNYFQTLLLHVMKLCHDLNPGYLYIEQCGNSLPANNNVQRQSLRP